MKNDAKNKTSLRVERLSIERRDRRVIVDHVVRDISFTLGTGEVIALTGEEGCGKSALAQALAGLLPRDGLRVSGGEIWLGDAQIVGMSRRKRRQIRQRKIAYFDRYTIAGLNPLGTIKEHFEEVQSWKSKAELEAAKSLIQALYEVGIAEPESVLSCLPGELSPEVLNRVVICMALQAGVDFIVADEMTADLDSTVEQQIFELLVDLKNRNELSMVIVSHHPGMIGAVADEVMVIYDGVVIERGKAEKILTAPEISYTKALMGSAPRLGEARLRLGSITEADRRAATEELESQLRSADKLKKSR
ncbi:MAG: ABC transporter ATP-binding protein [Verrucomicrobia bacterium]|nr:ABC transporter ATP-binding protein [Verrucomicrobiota bacterium]